MIKPPGWIIRFVEFYCPDSLVETVVGDLWEQYESDYLTIGKKYADRRAVWNALRFFRPGIIFKKRKSKLKINTAMFKTNILIAFRSMAKNSFHSIVNIVGLALSIAFLLLVYFFVKNEYSQDRFHTDTDRIYRLYQQIAKTETGEIDRTIVTMPVPLGPELAENFSGIEHSTRVITGGGNVRRGSESFAETSLLVDPDFFKVFDYPILEGNTVNPLQAKNEVFLSPDLAKKYFGLKDPLGEELEITFQDSVVNFFVGGIIDPMKSKSSLKFDLVIHLDYLAIYLGEDFMKSYNVGIIENYVKLKENDPGSLSQLTSTFFQEKTSREDSGEEAFVRFQPLSDVHLNNELHGGVAEVSNPVYSYIFIGLGVLVLIIATLNYIMLTSSHSLTRTKEFGVRKTMGAIRVQLILQLVTESLMLSTIAAALGVVAAWGFLPVFNSLSGIELPFDLSVFTFLFVASLLFIVSVATGLLSSGFLVRLKPTEALKGNVRYGRGNLARKVMVVIQFTFSVCLIIATLVFRNQMKYIAEKDLGFDKEKLIELSLGSTGELEKSRELSNLFKNELIKHPEVEEVASVMNNMEDPWTRFGFDQEDGSVKFSFFNLVTPDYLQVMGLELLEGRDFRPKESGVGIIINEAFVREYGFEDPLHAQIPGKNFEGSHEIIGVVKDFHYSSLHEEIEPLMLACDFGDYKTGVTRLNSYNWPPLYNRLVIKSATNDLAQLEEILLSVWVDLAPRQPFKMSFYDDILTKKYENEKRWSSVFDYAAIFSLGIAWLGLIGLTQLTVKKRIKEVGIRKVLGSGSWNVSFLLSRQFIWLTGIASILSWPIAWYGLSKWLETFEYRIDLGLGWFLLAGVIVVGVTCISVWLQTIRAANMNPVRSLRVE